MIFIDEKYFFQFEIGYILIDLTLIFRMNSSELKTSISLESYGNYFSRKQTTFTSVKEVCVEKIDSGGQQVSRLVDVVELALSLDGC